MRTYTCPSGHVVLLDDVPPAMLGIGSQDYAQFWDAHRGAPALFHRWLLGLSPGDGWVGDHINRDVLDCRRSNLRVVTPAASNLNRRVAVRALPVGIYLTRQGRYQARLKRDGRQTTHGTFASVEKALDARDRALVST